MVQTVSIQEREAVYFVKKRFIHMRLALCDDDRTLIKEIKPIIYEYANKHRFEMVIDEFYSGEDLLDSSTTYDIIFLDYQMGELDGLDVAKKLRNNNINCAIIFMTNYPDFIYEAFEVNTFRFYKKPVNASQLCAALDGYFKMFGNDFPILLRCDREFIEVDTKDIVFLEAVNKSCIIHLVKSQLFCAKTMAFIYEQLPKNHFYKVHRAFIVNLNYISRYNNDEIIMKNGETVHVSRKYNTAFKDAYRAYSDLRNPKRKESGW